MKPITFYTDATLTHFSLGAKARTLALSLNNSFSKCLIMSFLGLFTLTPPTIHAQVAFSQLHYENEQERNSFQSIELRNPDYLGIFLYSNSNATKADYRELDRKLDALVKDLRRLAKRKKSSKRKAKIIYRNFDRSLLQTYACDATLIDIVDSAKYNDLTATVMYALLFERMDIPYAISEKPTGISMTLWPESEPLLIATNKDGLECDPVTDSLKRSSINLLANNGSIEKDEYLGMNEAQIFDHVMAKGGDNMNLRELAAIHYGKKGIHELGKGDFDRAMMYLEKSMWLEPNGRFNMVTNFTRSKYLAEHSQVDQRFIDRLVAYGNDPLNENGINTLIVAYGNVIESKLSDTTKWGEFNAISSEIFRRIEDSTMLNELKFGYHYAYGWANNRLHRYDHALFHFDSAFYYDPAYEKLPESFCVALVNSLKNRSDFDAMLTLINGFSKAHPTLDEDAEFNSIKYELYLRKAFMSMEEGQAEHGLRWLVRFEQEAPISATKLIDEELISMVYARASTVYFERGNREQARQLIEQGLFYIPNNMELLNRRAVL